MPSGLRNASKCTGFWAPQYRRALVTRLEGARFALTLPMDARLTPVQARVARSLASGKTVEDIACDGGVSPSTVRTHVRGVLEKTGCNRQVEVVALLAGIAQPRIAGLIQLNGLIRDPNNSYNDVKSSKLEMILTLCSIKTATRRPQAVA